MKTLNDYLPKQGDICGDFCRWMNQATKRVQVYTWRLANTTLPDHPGLRLFRAKPQYRDAETLEARQRVAAAAKCFRAGMRGNLPAFNEQSGEYVNMQTGLKF